MPVLIRSEVPGLTQELYDRLIAQFEPLVKQAPGFVSHVAGPIPGGWAVTEIWESQEQFNAWLTATVLPGAMAAGMNAPIITMTPLHHVIGSRRRASLLRTHLRAWIEAPGLRAAAALPL